MVYYDFVINKLAEKDMKKISDYFVKKSSSYIAVDRILDSMSDKISLIQLNPCMYQKLEKYQYKGESCRRMVIGNYSVIYYVLENERKIIIIHIVPNKSNFFNSRKIK